MEEQEDSICRLVGALDTWLEKIFKPLTNNNMKKVNMNKAKTKKYPVDARDKLWKRFEKKIQANAEKKDKDFMLKGKWKKFVRKEKGYKVYSVEAEWVGRNLCVYFGHGGHGLAHEFIPVDEIWVSSHHYNNDNTPLFEKCPCITKTKGHKVSKNYFDSTVIHEITECEEMKKGKTYWISHHIALDAEKKSGLLHSPFSDI